MSIVSNNIITIECREEVSNKKTDSNEDIGIYETILNNPVPIKDGSQVYIKSAFCDTASNSDGKIVVEEEITLNCHFCNYFVNFDETADPATTQPQKRLYSIGGPLTFPDGKKYIRSLTSAQNPVNQRKLLKIDLNKEKVIPHASHYGGEHFSFFYYDENDKKNSVSLYAPRVAVNEDCSVDVSSLNLMVRFSEPDKFGIDVPSNWSKAGINLSKHPIYTFGEIPPQPDAKLVPEINTITATIPQNKTGYDPQEIARLITDQFSQGLKNGNAPTANNPVQNPLLKTSLDFQGPDLTQSYYVAEDGSNVCSFKAGINSYVGTSQFSFIYDEEAKQYAFQAIHTPYFFGASMAVELIADEADGNNHYIDSAGGIIITGLDTNQTDGNFWIDTLGINPRIFGHASYTQKTIGLFNNWYIPSFDLERGRNITANFGGLDYNIKKPVGDTLDSRKTLMTVPALDDISGTTSTTIGCYGNKILAEGQATSGYFLIEADLGLYNEFIGQEESNKKIKAVLGRFYSKDSYTQGIDIGIPYVHKGIDTSIKSIKIRILDQNHQPVGQSGGLGTDNCVFFEVKQ